jgi:hypothetical protein
MAGATEDESAQSHRALTSRMLVSALVSLPVITHGHAQCNATTRTPPSTTAASETSSPFSLSGWPREDLHKH